MINSEWLFAVRAMTDGRSVSSKDGTRPHRFDRRDYAQWLEMSDAGMSHRMISMKTGAATSTIKERLQIMRGTRK